MLDNNASTEREFKLSVLSVDVERRELTVEMGVSTPAEGMQLRTFRVGYYDFPMIDNTRLSHDQRAAVVINQFGDRQRRAHPYLFPRFVRQLERESFLRRSRGETSRIEPIPLVEDLPELTDVGVFEQLPDSSNSTGRGL